MVSTLHSIVVPCYERAHRCMTSLCFLGIVRVDALVGVIATTASVLLPFRPRVQGTRAMPTRPCGSLATSPSQVFCPPLSLKFEHSQPLLAPLGLVTGRPRCRDTSTVHNSRAHFEYAHATLPFYQIPLLQRARGHRVTLAGAPAVHGGAKAQAGDICLSWAVCHRESCPLSAQLLHHIVAFPGLAIVDPALAVPSESDDRSW